MNQKRAQLALIFISLSSFATAFDGQLTQSILGTWQNITSKYMDISNRNIASIDPNTFTGLTQLEQLYVSILFEFLFYFFI